MLGAEDFFDGWFSAIPIPVMVLRLRHGAGLWRLRIAGCQSGLCWSMTQTRNGHHPAMSGADQGLNNFPAMWGCCRHRHRLSAIAPARPGLFVFGAVVILAIIRPHCCSKAWWAEGRKSPVPAVRPPAPKPAYRQHIRYPVYREVFAHELAYRRMAIQSGRPDEKFVDALVRCFWSICITGLDPAPLAGLWGFMGLSGADPGYNRASSDHIAACRLWGWFAAVVSH